MNNYVSISRHTFLFFSQIDIISRNEHIYLSFTLSTTLKGKLLSTTRLALWLLFGRRELLLSESFFIAVYQGFFVFKGQSFSFLFTAFLNCDYKFNEHVTFDLF